MPNVQLSFGPMLIGVYLNLILFGILIMQTFYYYQTYRSDSKWMKVFVAYLFIVEIANSILDMAMMYQPLIIGWGTTDATKYFPTLFLMEPIIIVLVSTPIQLFFAWRIKMITKSIWIPIIVVLFSLGSAAGGLWTGIRIPIVKLFANKPLLHWSALVWFLCSCISDVLITIVLVRSLSSRKTGFPATDSAIDKIIRSSDCADCAIFAIGDVIFFMALPHTALNFIWDLALSKIYSNCLMSTLNARATLQNSSGLQSNQRNGFFGDGISSRQPVNHQISYTHPGPQQSFELQASPISKPKAYGESYLSFTQDVDYPGVTVTKVVERMEDRHIQV
ncbi:hypothetical protein C8J56DRAFT_1089505 [Mycena floridula]|nr:hypothetical protein C8J56DRAFT_1104960 [Mycena floridula]KAJ7585311.1 hypothetical protein C8J56DRAFT_1089505 [Mycena floridula]